MENYPKDQKPTSLVCGLEEGGIISGVSVVGNSFPILYDEKNGEQLESAL